MSLSLIHIWYLTDLARRTGVVTQMGNEGHSNDTVYEVAEIVQSGCLGEMCIRDRRKPDGAHHAQRIVAKRDIGVQRRSDNAVFQILQAIEIIYQFAK